MIFRNREDAAEKLAMRLKEYEGKNALVLGIPRGAMPMAMIIAEKLKGRLGAVLVHKIPSPLSNELAIGSIGLSGHIHRRPEIIAMYHVTDSYIEEAAQEQLESLKRKQQRFGLPDLNCEGRLVILVDDGIATGATAIAAIHEVLAQKPKKLVVATAIVGHRAADEIRELVDQLVALDESDFFSAISEFYEDFSEVSDERVMEILREAGEKHALAA